MKSPALTRSRVPAALALALALFLALPGPARAATTPPFDLQTSAAQTATANGGGVSVSGINELTVFFSCTASSGTTETLDVLLQSSPDQGVTWYDMPFELGEVSAASGTETAPATNKRDFLELGADVACTGVLAVAKYRAFGSYVRVKWFISGTTPSYTFAVKAIGKN